MAKSNQRTQAIAAKLRSLAAQYAHLSPQKQQLAYYYAGKTESDFIHAIFSGDAEAQTHATHIIFTGEYLDEQDADIYNAIIRPALHEAYRCGKLTPSLHKTWRNIEEETLKGLMKKGYFSEPSTEQDAALKRIPHQHRLMKELFGIDSSHYYLEFEDWPVVPPPRKLITKLCTHGAIPTDLKEPLCNNSLSLLMDFYHAEEGDFDEIPRLHHIPLEYRKKQCYFFGRENTHTADWLIAPFHELEELCGLSIAADGSFFCIGTEWQEYYGKVLH